MSYKNLDSVRLFEEMTAMGSYFGSGRPVKVDPAMIIDDILAKVPIQPSDEILDVGCGTGVVTIPLATHCKSVTALDAGEKILAKAKKNARKRKVQNIHFKQGWATELPFEDRQFDHVIMYAAIHYLENSTQIKICLSELIRVCKPEGSILIAEIPEIRARQAFESRTKTSQEQHILQAFNQNRLEYDRRFQRHVRTIHDPNYLILDGQKLVAWVAKLGRPAQILTQDIRLPFSLTRRDLLILPRN